jgi:hypothetical protein
MPGNTLGGNLLIGVSHSLDLSGRNEDGCSRMIDMNLELIGYLQAGRNT